MNEEIAKRIASLSQGKRNLLMQHLGRLQRSKEVYRTENLITVKSGETDAPFFCVHPVGGEVAPYVELARELTWKRPFCGIRATGLDDGQEPYKSVAAMASHYVKCLRSHQKKGPYLLGGWSMGGLVAFEMACQLVAAGQEVLPLILIDAALPHDGHRLADLSSGQILVSFARDLWGRKGEGVVLDVDMLDNEQTLERQLERVLEMGIAAGVLRQLTDLHVLKRMFQVCECNYFAMRDYAPRERFEGDAIVIQAALRSAKKNEGIAAHWNRLVRGKVILQTAAGDHFGIMRAPGVSQVAAVIDAEFASTSQDITDRIERDGYSMDRVSVARDSEKASRPG